MRLKHNSKFIVLICLIEILSHEVSHPQTPFAEALKMDLKRVDETWRVLDKYANQAWPGWKNYTEIPFRLDYPNGLSLHIGLPNPLGKFKLVDSVLLRGKKIYLDDSRKNSLPISPRLTFGGGGAGLGTGHPALAITRALITERDERDADSLLRSLGNTTWPKEIVYSTDYTIACLTHELFHCFADFGPIFRQGDTLFLSDVNYAVFSEIEGDLLEDAAFEFDSTGAKNLLRQSLIARDMKRRSMSPYQKTYESDQEKCEGTAEYAAYRIVQLLKNGYEPSLNHNEDPLYFGFRYCDYFPAITLNTYHEYRKNTLAVSAKSYSNGFFICIILDKLMPNWKADFFQNKTSMDQLLEQVANLKAGDTPSLLDSIRRKYNYTELIHRHSIVIISRDSLIKYFQDPKLKSFALKFSEMSMLPAPNITSSGTVYRHRLQSYYSSGVTNIQLGDMTCVSEGIPICYDMHSDSIILPDLEPQDDQAKYDLKYARKEADEIFYDVTIITKSFTLRAAKLQVVKGPTQVAFKVLPVAK